MRFFGKIAKILGWLGIGIGITTVTGYCRAKFGHPISSDDIIETYFVDENP